MESFQIYSCQVGDGLTVLEFFLRKEGVSLPPRLLETSGKELLGAVAGALQRLRRCHDGPFRLGQDVMEQVKKVEVEHPASGKGARQSAMNQAQLHCNRMGASLLGKLYVSCKLVSAILIRERIG